MSDEQVEKVARAINYAVPPGSRWDRDEAVQVARAAIAAMDIPAPLADANAACLELAAAHGFATGHGDTVADMIREFSAQIGQWRPIESAPRDGTPVELWHHVWKCAIAASFQPSFRALMPWIEITKAMTWPEEAFTHWRVPAGTPAPPEADDSIHVTDGKVATVRDPVLNRKVTP